MLSGLSQRQVVANRKKYGQNSLPMPRRKSALEFLIDVFRDKINLILLVMLGIFIGMNILGVGSVYEIVGLGTVLLVVCLITVITQLKSQRRAIELRMATSYHMCNVVRDGVIRHIDSVEIVVDDIVILAAGDMICADGYIVDGCIAVDNSILNGESEECEKSPIKNYKYSPNKNIGADDYTDQNSLFSGTMVLSGAGMMRVTRVGTATENAKIMIGMENISELKTNLQTQIDNIADIISRVGSLCAILVCAILIFVGVLRGTLGTGMDAVYAVLQIVTVALTIFVAAVPEGLPFIISIITSRNVHTMIKQHILAKNPHKIPEAGNLQIICTDKTGTLTQGILVLTGNFLGDGTDAGIACKDVRAAHELFIADAVMNTNAAYDSKRRPVGGNSTDRALLGGVSATDAASIRKRISVIKSQPFDSANKFSYAKIRRGMRGKCITLFRGAPEIILAQCTKCISRDGSVIPLDHKKIDAVLKNSARRAMRMVACAYYDGDCTQPTHGMVLTCLCAMRDEIRPGVPAAISDLRRANIQVMMITGDILETAAAIAHDCGIISDADDMAVTSYDLDGRSDAWVKKNLHRIRVIARATPATKLRIVTLAQELNKTIGMCGDGTNDAPALRRADVGFAMGDGTDVCKQASDIIITDSNFVSVANCVLMGRTFMHNVISFLRFQLPINFAMVIVCIAFPLLFGMDAFVAVQILIINIVMDSLNSLAFGGEPPHAEYMQAPAPTRGAPLLGRKGILNVAISTILFLGLFGLIMTPFARNVFNTADQWMSARFAMLVIMAMANGFNIRTDGYNIFKGLWRNMAFVWVAIGVIVGVVLCVQYGGDILNTVPLNMTQWMVVFAVALLIIPLDMVRKFILDLLGR